MSPAPYDYSSGSGYTRARADWVDLPTTTTPIQGAQLDKIEQAVADLKQDVLNVKDFGAVGDGSTSDTAAVQACFNAMATLGSNVYFPTGNYKCGPLTITSKHYWTMTFASGAFINPTSGVGLTISSSHAANINNIRFALKTGSTATGCLDLNFATRMTLQRPQCWYDLTVPANHDAIRVQNGSHWVSIHDAVVRPNAGGNVRRGIWLDGSTANSNAVGIWGGDFVDCTNHIRIQDCNACRVWGSAFEGSAPGTGQTGVYLTGGDNQGTSVFGTRAESVEWHVKIDQTTLNAFLMPITIERLMTVHSGTITELLNSTGVRINYITDATVELAAHSVSTLLDPRVKLRANSAQAAKMFEARDSTDALVWGVSHLGVMTVGPTATIRAGTGTPESVVTAPVGSLFLRLDGGATTTLYVKTSGAGNTGWTAK